MHNKPHNTITDHDAEVLRKLKKKVDNIRGDGVTNTPTGIVIRSTAAAPQKASKVTKAAKFPTGSPRMVLQIGSNGEIVVDWLRAP